MIKTAFVVLSLLGVCFGQQFTFSARDRIYKVLVESLPNSGIEFEGHWLYQASGILPSEKTNYQYVLLFNSNLNPRQQGWPIPQAIFMATSTDGFTFNTPPTAILQKAPNICDMMDARPIYRQNAWHVYVQARPYFQGNCPEGAISNSIYVATGPTLTNLTWYRDGAGNAIPVVTDGWGLNPGIGEDIQWFNTAPYGGSSAYPIIGMFNNWSFTQRDLSVCPTCAANGTPLFAYVSPDGLSEIYYHYYTSPAVADPLVSENPLLKFHPDVLLAGTSGHAIFGPPGFAFSNDCSGSSQIGRGVGFFSTPVPTGGEYEVRPYEVDRRGRFKEGDFASSSPGLILSTRLARDPYGYLNLTGTSPPTWQTYLYYNGSNQKNGVMCPLPDIHDTWRNDGSPGNPKSRWRVSRVTITEEPGDTPTAVFKDGSPGSIWLSRYDTGSLYYAGGLFGSTPGAARNAAGDTIAAAIDNSGNLHANTFVKATNAWGSWTSSGSGLAGSPAVAVGTNGAAYIAVRDTWGSYWLASYTPGGGFGPWTYLAGVFASDPAIAAASDGSLYIVGRDTYNSLYSGRFIPGSGFQSWVYGGGVVKGQPSVSVGSDGIAYVVARDLGDAAWAARVRQNDWLSWWSGGGLLGTDPQVVSLGNGTLKVVAVDTFGTAIVRNIEEGAGDPDHPERWVGPNWVEMGGGNLISLSVTAHNGVLYACGRSQWNTLWWYGPTAGTGWFSAGVASGPPVAAKR